MEKVDEGSLAPFIFWYKLWKPEKKREQTLHKVMLQYSQHKMM